VIIFIYQYSSFVNHTIFRGSNYHNSGRNEQEKLVRIPALVTSNIHLIVTNYPRY